LPLFFEQTATLFDYLPEPVLLVEDTQVRAAAESFLAGVGTRYEERRHDTERPLLPPERLYLRADELAAHLNRLTGVLDQSARLAGARRGYAVAINFEIRTLPPLAVQPHASEPAGALRVFLSSPGRRARFVAESTGRGWAWGWARGWEAQPHGRLKRRRT
jgi:transcription-repair coupling factor (superfamily II helicase)